MRRKTNTSVFYLIILIQTFVISFLAIRIYGIMNHAPDKAAIYPLKKDVFIKTATSDLKYYYELKPNSTERFVDAHTNALSIQTINDDGLNERFDYKTPSPERTYRIITLGDSLTYGLKVDTQNNFSEQLEDLLNQNLNCKNIDRFEVINLGVPGYDIQYTVERFKRHGQKYKPDLILWLLIPNDFNEIKEYMSRYMEPVYKQIEQEGELDYWSVKRNRLYYQAEAKAQKQMKTEINDQQLLQFYEKAILKLDNFYDKKILYLSTSQLDEKNKNLLNAIVKRDNNDKFYSSLPTYPDRLFFSDGSINQIAHPSVEGHKAISEDLLEHITRGKIIPCQK